MKKTIENLHYLRHSYIILGILSRHSFLNSTERAERHEVLVGVFTASDAL